jgi:extradiol dioxygenase family protein
MPDYPFHIAITVRNIPEARHFYGELMGFPEGRSDQDWIDFNMYGHQLVVHLDPTLGENGKVRQWHNPVDEHQVPVPHCGVVLSPEEWNKLKKRVSEFIDEFVLEPYTRFAGEPGEQSTMFFADPSGNALEFKAFRDIETELFRK